MVEKAIANIKANGQEKAFVEINNPSGLFVDRDMYVTVIDMNGKCLARGFDPDLLGKDLTELKDPDGRFFIKERIEMAKTKGSGWQNYKSTDPITKNVETLSSCVGLTNPRNEEIVQIKTMYLSTIRSRVRNGPAFLFIPNANVHSVLP